MSGLRWVFLTCVQVAHHVDAGSDGHGAVHEGRAGLDAQVLVVQEHPPAMIQQQEIKKLNGFTGLKMRKTNESSIKMPMNYSEFVFPRVIRQHFAPPHLIVIELRLAGHHLSLLGVFILLASDATKHVELLAHAAGNRAEPDARQRS